LKKIGSPLPAVMITGQSNVAMAVEVMKAGASDFLEKPLRGVELLAGVARALEPSRDSGKLTEWRKDAADHLASVPMLTDDSQMGSDLRIWADEENRTNFDRRCGS
jgi:two-component system CheB/CheR fusion protein